jgi:predicted PurR-regulated permease PerM
VERAPAALEQRPLSAGHANKDAAGPVQGAGLALLHLEREHLPEPGLAGCVEDDVATGLQLKRVQGALIFEAAPVHRGGQRQDRGLQRLAQPAILRELVEVVVHLRESSPRARVAHHPNWMRRESREPVRIAVMMRGRVSRHGEGSDERPPQDEFVEIEVADLAGTFSAPGWLRDVGLTSWLLVGAVLLLAGVVALLALTHTIVMPLVAAGIVAAVASPLIAWLHGHGVPRLIGAVLVLLALVAVSVLMLFAIVGGITSETDDLKGHLSEAKNTVTGWAQDLGVASSTAEGAKNDASSSTTSAVDTLLHGVAAGIESLSSILFFLALTALSLIFLLKDGPQIRAWVERRMGVPLPVARTVTGRMLGALRAYFFGVTIVAIFNAVVVGAGAVLLGVPLAGTIAVVTFAAAYIPYLGAWSAGAFSVLVALGGAGTDAAIGMAVVQLLANGILQQLIQPIAYGAALGIHPLAVLIVTIGGGALFGAVGLILAAPLTSAIVLISADLSAARSKDAPDTGAAGQEPLPTQPAPG